MFSYHFHIIPYKHILNPGAGGSDFWVSAAIQRRFSGDSAAIQRLVFSTFLESAWLIFCSRCSYAWHATSADRSSPNSAQEGSLGRAGWACGLAGGLGAAASPGGRASVAVDNGCLGPGPAAGGPVARSAGSRCPSPFGYGPRARRGLPADVFTDPFLGVCRKQIRRTSPILSQRRIQPHVFDIHLNL